MEKYVCIRHHYGKVNYCNSTKEYSPKEDIGQWFYLNIFKRLLRNPDSLSVDEIQNLLMNFLVHVPAHVAAASKLVTGLPVEDILGVGAVSESKE